MTKSFSKGKKVKVLSGSDKGKTGTIIKLLAKQDKAVVQGINIKTHFDKEDGLLKKEDPILLCKLKLV